MEDWLLWVLCACAGWMGGPAAPIRIDDAKGYILLGLALTRGFFLWLQKETQQIVRETIALEATTARDGACPAVAVTLKGTTVNS